MPHIKMDRLCKPIRAERLTPILFENIPNIVIYCVCFGYFFACTSTLVQRYLLYDTTVLIKYEQQTSLRFPAITVCGCSTKKVVCGGIDADLIIEREMKEYGKYSAMDILNNKSFKVDNLITSCNYIIDSRRPDKTIPCHEVEPVVESLHDGRKCITFLTKLHDGKQLSEKDIQKNFVNNAGNTSYINIEINFQEALKLDPNQIMQSLQDSNVYIAIHPAEIIPTQEDTEILRLEPGMKYELHFGKQVTRLLEPPYNTKCKYYDSKIKPRSQYECIQLCMLKRSYNHNNGSCINHYNLITNSWLQYMHWKIDPNTVRFCTNQTDRSYAVHIFNGRDCDDECKHRDCVMENYNFATESSTIGKGYGWDENNCNTANRTVVQIWPDRKLSEVVQHFKEIDIFQLIGCLGGHAHIFLGLSAIQLYDVVCDLIRRMRQFYTQIV